VLSPAASLALVRSPPLRGRATPPRARSRRPSWARPWAARAALAEVEPGQARPRALHRPAAPALCHWAVGGFGLVAFDYIFIFSEYIQFLVNSKICVGFV
jgi:hypothetical protein